MKGTLEYDKNEDALKLLVSEYNRKSHVIEQGGGKKKLEKIKAKGKLNARERVALLLDDADDFLELGKFAAYDMYEEFGGCPSAGVVIGIGQVAGKQCIPLKRQWKPATTKARKTEPA